MSKLNKDGLAPGEPVSFETLQATLNKHKEAAKNDQSNAKQPKIRKPRKPRISDAQEAGEPEAQEQNPAAE